MWSGLRIRQWDTRYVVQRPLTLDIWYLCRCSILTVYIPRCCLAFLHAHLCYHLIDCIDRHNYFPFDPGIRQGHLGFISPRTITPHSRRHPTNENWTGGSRCMSNATAARWPNPQRFLRHLLHRFSAGFDSTYVAQAEGIRREYSSNWNINHEGCSYCYLSYVTASTTNQLIIVTSKSLYWSDPVCTSSVNFNDH